MMFSTANQNIPLATSSTDTDTVMADSVFGSPPASSSNYGEDRFGSPPSSKNGAELRNMKAPNTPEARTPQRTKAIATPPKHHRSATTVVETTNSGIRGMSQSAQKKFLQQRGEAIGRQAAIIQAVQTSYQQVLPTTPGADVELIFSDWLIALLQNAHALPTFHDVLVNVFADTQITASEVDAVTTVLIEHAKLLKGMLECKQKFKGYVPRVV
jgi:hypothetical protein